MSNRYRKLQTVKHALQYYINRSNASKKDLVREKNLLNQIDKEVKQYQEKYGIGGGK